MINKQTIKEPVNVSLKKAVSVDFFKTPDASPKHSAQGFTDQIESKHFSLDGVKQGLGKWE